VKKGGIRKTCNVNRETKIEKGKKAQKRLKKAKNG